KTSDEEAIPEAIIVNVAVATSILLVLYFDLFPIVSPSHFLDQFNSFGFFSMYLRAKTVHELVFITFLHSPPLFYL
ncbi:MULTISPECIES: hypothetical protein, partial [Bacillus cereus group]|uniref:hypothetical protein n=1 Tax=Bacillus cereus group TaxID=86661 RepID=UPI001C3F25B5